MSPKDRPSGRSAPRAGAPAAQAPHTPVIRLKTQIRETPVIRLRKNLQQTPSVQVTPNCVMSML